MKNVLNFRSLDCLYIYRFFYVIRQTLVFEFKNVFHFIPKRNPFEKILLYKFSASLNFKKNVLRKMFYYF